MSEQKVFIAGYIPDEQSVKDFGARRVATAFHAKDEKHAAAKASFIFMEEYPGAQDAAYKHLLCEEVPGIPRPALNDWDEDFLYEYDWSEDLGHPVAIGAGQEPQPVEFEKLSQLMKIAILVKYDRAEITTDLLPAALELTQGDEHQARKTGTFTGADVGKQLAAERGEYVEGISDPNDPKWVKENQSAPQTEVKNHGNGRFSIDSLMTEQPKSLVQESPKATADAAKNAEAQPAAPSQVDYQSIGASLESELEAKGDNLQIWRRVMRTDPRYTKELSGAGFEGTSINAEYMVMRATEIFGPIGSGWGFEVLEERMIPGAPMSEAIYEDKNFVGNRLLRDADGTLITEQNHSIKIEFWYQDAGNKKRFESYGATKYLYKSKHGITCDGEAQKKSLTDAIKKALSLLGFSADVWLGLYDQAEYKQENAIEFDIRNASDKAEDVTRIRKELDEKFKLNTESMRAAVTPNEVSGIASSLTRVMGVHLKAAREKADLEYAKYLEGRLRRLEEVKTECLAKLQEKAA